MSSTNNAPDDTVINVENDATISNQSRGEEVEGNQHTSSTSVADPESSPHLQPSPTRSQELRLYIRQWIQRQPNDHPAIIMFLYYSIWIFLSYIFGIYYLFPVLYPIFSWLLAFFGFLVKDDRYFYPFIFSLFCDMIYACLSIIFLITFYTSDNFYSRIFIFPLQYLWPEKAKKFEKLVESDFLVLYLMFCIISVFINAFIACILEDQISEFRKKLLEKKIEKEVTRQTTIISAEIQGQQLQNYLNQQPFPHQNPYAEMLAQIPPPPSYQSNTRLSPPQTPENGIPPPTYSMLEREEQLELNLVNDDASQQSINIQQLLSDDITQDSNDTLSSPINNSNDLTAAISASSILN